MDGQIAHLPLRAVAELRRLGVGPLQRDHHVPQQHLVRVRVGRIVLISPEELKLPSYVKKDVLQKNNIPYLQTTDLEAVMPELDIL